MKTIFIALVAIIQLLFFGCATVPGPSFKEIPVEDHKGKGIVYFYRHSHPGSAYTLDLRINSGEILPLPNKGYYVFILDPGNYNFAVSYKSKLHAEDTFTFEGDKVYFIRYRADVVGYTPGLFATYPKIGYSITSDKKENALEVLKTCRLIEIPKKP